MGDGASAPDPWGGRGDAAGHRSAAGWGEPRPSGPTGPADPTPGWGASRSAGSWNSSSSAATPRSFVGPPYVFLWIAVGAAILAIGLSFLPFGLAVYVPAWVIAGFLGFGSAILFVQRDAVRQAEVFYARDPRSRWFYRAAILLSFVAVVVTATRIAMVIGRMG